MKTDVNILKQFQTVLNRKVLSEEAVNRLLEIWDLADVDLEAEAQKINEKKSNLSKSRRDAVLEFIKLKELLKEKKEAEAKAMSFNENEQSLAQDTLTV